MINQSRIVETTFGDWAHEGHGRTLNLRFELSGRDVSDEALLASLKQAELAVGIKLETIFSDNENSSLYGEYLMKILEGGLLIGNVDTTKDTKLAYYVDDDTVDCAIEAGHKDLASNREFDAVKLVMAFIGFSIENFTYREIIPPKPLIGGFNALIENFGYGLFSN